MKPAKLLKFRNHLKELNCLASSAFFTSGQVQNTFKRWYFEVKFFKWLGQGELQSLYIFGLQKFHWSSAGLQKNVLTYWFRSQSLTKQQSEFCRFASLFHDTSVKRRVNKTNFCVNKTDYLSSVVDCQRFRKESKKRQTKIMFQRCNSFFHHWLRLRVAVFQPEAKLQTCVNKFPHLKPNSTALFSERFSLLVLLRCQTSLCKRFDMKTSVTWWSSFNPNNLYIPCYKTNRIQRSIKYQGVKVKNSIPIEIQNLSKSRFKIKLKSQLMQDYLKEINWFYLEHLW